MYNFLLLFSLQSLQFISPFSLYNSASLSLWLLLLHAHLNMQVKPTQLYDATFNYVFMGPALEYDISKLGFFPFSVGIKWNNFLVRSKWSREVNNFKISSFIFLLWCGCICSFLYSFFVSVFILDSAVLCSPDWIEIHCYSLLPASWSMSHHGSFTSFYT